jgi:hypothetical protein
MSGYSGDVVGMFVWIYEDEGVITRHAQDPLFLTTLGASAIEECEWEGCGCSVQDNNHPYCMQCYDSLAEHKSVANTNDLKSSDPSYDVRILREIFDDRCRPWLQENEAIAKEDVPHLTFKLVNDVVYYDQWECTHTLENFNIVQEYCFLKQIEYYFDHCDSQMCWFHVYN